MVKAVLTRRRLRRAVRDRVGQPSLDGVKRGDWRASPEAARRLATALAQRGEIAYWVATPKAETTSPRRAEQRGGAREKMRLRSAKLLDAAYRFVCECRIFDRSANGLRLTLARNIGLPSRMAVHIDETGEVRHARVVWRRGPMIGLRLHEAAPEGALTPSDRFALRERYYGILD